MGPGYVFELITVVVVGVIITFFTTSVDVVGVVVVAAAVVAVVVLLCTGSFCFCCVAIVVDAYRRKIFEAAVLFSRSWIDRLFRCLLLNATAAAVAADPLLWSLLLLLALSSAELRWFFPATVAVAPEAEPDVDDPVLSAPPLLLPLTIRNNRTRLATGPAPSTADPATVVVAELAAVDATESFPLVVVWPPILATNRCNTAVVGAEGSALRLLCLLLWWLWLWWWFLESRDI